MIKKNKFLGNGALSPTKAAEVIKSWEEQSKPVCNTVYEVWRFTKPKTKEGLWFPQDLTVRHKGILKNWAKWVEDFGFDPKKVLKYLIEEWEFIRQEMYVLLEQPVVEQLMKRRSELLNYYIANTPKTPMKMVEPSPVKKPVTNLVTNLEDEKMENQSMISDTLSGSINATNCTTGLKKKPNIIIRRKSVEPDANCYTLPNGECISTKPCMHSAKPPSSYEQMTQDLATQYASRIIQENESPRILDKSSEKGVNQWYEMECGRIKRQFEEVDRLRGKETMDEIISSKKYGFVVWQYQKKVEQVYKLARKALGSPVTMSTPKNSPVEDDLGNDEDLGVIPDYEE